MPLRSNTSRGRSISATTGADFAVTTTATSPSSIATSFSMATSVAPRMSTAWMPTEISHQGALASQLCCPWTTTSSCCSSWPSISSMSSSGRLGLIRTPFLISRGLRFQGVQRNRRSRRGTGGRRGRLLEHPRREGQEHEHRHDARAGQRAAAEIRHRVGGHPLLADLKALPEEERRLDQSLLALVRPELEEDRVHRDQRPRLELA